MGRSLMSGVIKIGLTHTKGKVVDGTSKNNMGCVRGRFPIAVAQR